VFIDLDADPHFLVFGDPESGKTSFLRLLATSIATRCTPQQARIMIADYRRTLLDAVTGEHLIGYGASAAALTSQMAEVSQAIRERMPGPDVTPEQLRTGKWWTGPHLVLLVDDYDLMAPAANPLQPLIELLPQARDLGLHLVITRRTAGAGRAMFDPVIQRLRELDTPGILLSGDRDEGVLLGRSVRPAIQPPGRGTLVNRRTGPITVQLAYGEQEDHATDIDPSPGNREVT
jgi:S-DNA-T family DNA segregation ATPase FtsK/SpoIIIE